MSRDDWAFAVACVRVAYRRGVLDGQDDAAMEEADLEAYAAALVADRSELDGEPAKLPPGPTDDE